MKIYASQEWVEGKIEERFPAPVEAEIGQTIVVKAVDENGKPTEWECADFPECNCLTSTARSLLVNLLRNSVYISDQSTTLTTFEKALSSGKWLNGKFYFDLVQGRISGVTIPGYILTNVMNRASYTGLNCTITPGKTYRLVGIDGVRYGIQTITKYGYTNIQNNSSVLSVDHGWQSNGYEFTANSDDVCVWLTASFTSGDITPEQAMPVYLEIVEPNINPEEPGQPEEPKDLTILHNWDFTKSLVDTIGGQEAIPSVAPIGDDYSAGSGTKPDSCGVAPTQDSEGIHFTGAGQVVYFGSVFGLNRTYEIDIANFEPQITGKNVRLLMFGTDQKPNSGLVFRGNNTIGWSFYSGAWSGQIFTGLTERNAISGKKVTLKIDANGNVKLLLDNVSYGTASVKAKSEWTKVQIGSTGDDLGGGANAAGCTLYNCTITGFRIYEGV